MAEGNTMTLIALALSIAIAAASSSTYYPSQHDNLADCVRPDGTSYVAEVGACRTGDFEGRPCKTAEGKHYWVHSWKECLDRGGKRDIDPAPQHPS